MTKRCVVAAWGIALLATSAAAQELAAGLTAASQTTAHLREWDSRLERMARSGELRVRYRREDSLADGRVHERADQYFRGVRVFGADVSRQLLGGRLMSVFGNIYPAIEIDTAPRLSEEEARAIAVRRAGIEGGTSIRPELVILPLQHRFVLTWRVRVVSARDITQFFVDARDGSIALEYSDRKTQAPSGSIGTARGVLGDLKKISVSPNSAGFVASDMLRPPSLRTYDMRGDWERVSEYLEGDVTLSTSDLASDSDNEWTDGAAGDAHVYTGWTYDYYYKRFGRRGLDNTNVPLVSLVHPIRRIDFFALFEELPDLFLNAFYAGGGVTVYGVGAPAGITFGGQTWDFLSGALDVVAHELTHGVTEYTSNLVYRSESGALNEAFSDMMATGAEFSFQRPGPGTLQADYLIGEDVVRPGGFRSLSNPRAFGQPDHYALRYTGEDDNGGVHINCGIPNQAFYLAIEGGTNRTSALSVQGVGAANREQIEKVFYRAFSEFLPSNATFAVARAATIQSARDLYGVGSAAERAVQQAWAAVGVQ